MFYSVNFQALQNAKIKRCRIIGPSVHNMKRYFLFRRILFVHNFFTNWRRWKALCEWRNIWTLLNVSAYKAVSKITSKIRGIGAFSFFCIFLVLILILRITSVKSRYDLIMEERKKNHTKTNSFISISLGLLWTLQLEIRLFRFLRCIVSTYLNLELIFVCPKIISIFSAN